MLVRLLKWWILQICNMKNWDAWTLKTAIDTNRFGNKLIVWSTDNFSLIKYNQYSHTIPFSMPQCKPSTKAWWSTLLLFFLGFCVATTLPAVETVNSINLDLYMDNVSFFKYVQNYVRFPIHLLGVILPVAIQTQDTK